MFISRGLVGGWTDGYKVAVIWGRGIDVVFKV
jgi:hypothetical protein